MSAERRLSFQTLQTGAEPCTHLELWPAGTSLCGIDLFPVDREKAPGFSRQGGQTGGGWEEPCPECLRRVKRFTSQFTVGIHGLDAAVAGYTRGLRHHLPASVSSGKGANNGE